MAEIKKPHLTTCVNQSHSIPSLFLTIILLPSALYHTSLIPYANFCKFMCWRWTNTESPNWKCYINGFFFFLQIPFFMNRLLFVINFRSLFAEVIKKSSLCNLYMIQEWLLSLWFILWFWLEEKKIKHLGYESRDMATREEEEPLIHLPFFSSSAFYKMKLFSFQTNLIELKLDNTCEKPL